MKFKNQSTGATSYTWDLGNGATSTELNPSASYTTPGTYTIKLTAKGAAGTDDEVKTAYVTVYKNPVADFTLDNNKGCLPVAVKFATDKSSAGDGSISSYAWDFGDGAPGIGASPAHTYTFAQTYTVSLTVKNNHGCSNTKTVPNALTVSPKLVADFSVPNTYLCAAPATVPLTNLSTIGADVVYAWDFGDGTTGDQAQPANHVYQTKGTYAVKLDVSNSIGCKASKTSATPINVANFSADFTLPANICQNAILSATATTDPTPSSFVWYVDNYQVGYASNLYTTMYSVGKHTVTLSAMFGTCEAKVTKEIDVKPIPAAAFDIEDKPYCTLPIDVKFTDKTPGATKWSWTSGTGLTSTEASPSFTYKSEGFFYPSLTVTNADGCSTTVGRYINISEPEVFIYYNTNDFGYCEGAEVSFYTYGDELVSYEWNFGDGSPVSTDARPNHVYPTAGSYPVSLKYKTKDGCEGTVVIPNNINIYKKPKPDFTAPTSVCGYNAAQFNDLTPLPHTSRTWAWGDGFITLNDRNPLHAFEDGPADFYVTLTVYNETCFNTVTKKITVTAPYPKFVVHPVDCSDRLRVNITDNSVGSTTTTWDFGDGKTEVYAGVAPRQITHLYDKSGLYTVRITVTDGTCTSSREQNVRVIDVSPITIASEKSTLCRNETVLVKTTVNDNTIHSYYDWFYNGMYANWSASSTTNTYSNLTPGKASFKVQSYNPLGCLDVSNEVTVDVTGPTAKFNFPSTTVCHGTPMYFTDASDTQFSAPLKTWTFNYGDGSKEETYTTNGPFSHAYDRAAYYTVGLKVTDEKGCYHSYYESRQVTIVGPNADFTAPTLIGPGIDFNIYNNTETWLSTGPQTYKWDFGDGTTSALMYPGTKKYATKGTYTIILTVKDALGCTDTIKKVIKVSDVSADFSYTLDKPDACPPVTVQFTNKSVNAKTILWDFGDGSSSRILNPSHTYTYAGVYKVKLSVVGEADNTDEKIEIIEFKGPKGTISASANGGCLTKEITFKVEADNVTSYSWDFTDGQVIEAKDKTISHTFKNAGIYNPRLIMGDGSACKGVAFLDEPIVIDKLDLKLKTMPLVVCDSGLFNLEVAYNSFSIDDRNEPGVYTWTVGDGFTMSDEDTKTPSVYANKLGNPEIKLHVLTQYGCEQTVSQVLKVAEKPIIGITGPLEACAKSEVLFDYDLVKGDAATTKWKWDFDGSGSSTLATPKAQQFNHAGSFDVQLIANNDNGCSDTANHTINIWPLPIPKAAASAPTICLGESTALTSEGGVLYQWDNAASLNNASSASPTASPEYTTTYTVKVVDAKGCENTDEVNIRVVRPLTVDIAPISNFCLGDPLQLQASGADTYVWTGDALNNPNIAAPVSMPTVTGVYTYKVVGYDKEGCFSDENEISVTVEPAPTVDAGMDRITPGGAAITLSPIISGDVVRLTWVPDRYLSCNDCPNPQALLNKSTTYTITVENAYGCKAQDEVDVKLVCNQGAVFIPTGFSPNADGKNDRFFPLGSGIREIRSMRIYNRWGNLMYERRGFQVNDRSVGWDGTFQGKKAAAGSYLYFIEAECEENTLFEYKGFIMLVR
ncbi:PKD domain-containing protein [Chitinophaga horti]|uniref:PKD domain-containing protein n=1 Tax=Chitinophaga horti TaxID=2920382 RepID=UPI002559B786|nr:PKD domain-containing protein [Chitinophaga horti]